MKIYKCIKFGLFFVLGISIFFLMKQYMLCLRYFIGGLITLYGIDGFCSWFFEKDREQKMHFLFKAIVQLILGVSTLVLITRFEIICVIWAVWAILREADEIAEYYEMFKEKVPCLLGFLESVIAIVFSIMLIMEPGEHHAKIHMYLLIVELLSTVIFPQLRFAYFKYIKKDKEAPIEDKEVKSEQK